MSFSRSSWKKVKKIQNKVNSIFHKCPNYPILPEKIPENSLPLQIGSKVQVEAYNTFLDHNTSTGYKFHFDNGNVYIVGMANTVHECIVDRLIVYFKVPNGGVADDPPIATTLRSFHPDPSLVRTKIAADIAVCPDDTLVQTPLNPGPPPGDSNGNPHARIVVEIAVDEDTGFWNTKCETWLLQEYVRYVFGVKIHERRQRSHHRSMTARLWTRELPAPLGSTPLANPLLAGVSVLEWDFGTLALNNQRPTGCTSAGNANYIVTIPVADVFWDPPINAAGVPIAVGYTAPVPTAVTANNFVIDLYRLQQIVLKRQ